MSKPISHEAFEIIKRHPDWYFLGESETYVDMSEGLGYGYRFIKKSTKKEDHTKPEDEK